MIYKIDLSKHDITVDKEIQRLNLEIIERGEIISDITATDTHLIIVTEKAENKKNKNLLLG